MLFKNFDAIYLDGIAMVWLMKIISSPLKRNSFDMTSIAPKVFEKAELNRETVYFLGAKEKEIVAFVKMIEKAFPNLKIVGYNNGYFINKNAKEKILNSIISISPDLLIVGMGTPYQEEILLEVRKKGWYGTGYTCGGFFHQTTERINYYPRIVDKLNLRWLYRIYDEPKLFKRYFFDYPKSFVLFTFDLIKYAFSIKG
jgi:N-acetylglucosaminyldiphosphoundecaprenol N-acetyl-beta-D-mannosaminyltransferase